MADGKVALVIGAGDATGGAIARRFAVVGFQAVVTRRARNLEQLERLADGIRAAGGRAHAFGTDARDEDEMVAWSNGSRQRSARSRSRSTMSAATSASRSWRRRRGSTRRSGRCAPSAAF